MPENDTLATLHAAVNCYLSMLETVAHTVEEACPPIGRPYGQRLSRLRARLAFDSSREKMEESRAITEQELKDYSTQAAAYAEQHTVELRRAVEALAEIVPALVERQEFYGDRLRRLAMQIEQERSAESAAECVAALLSCLESMSHESQSLLRKTREEGEQLERRLEFTQITDPVTGLINRREMERCIAAAKERGEKPVLLLFDFGESLPDRGCLPDEVARQVSARLGSQFRHHDLISRWSESQFLVLFKGREEIARARGEQILPWVAGRYQLDNGTAMQVPVEVRLLSETRLAEMELAQAR
jgi:GGDEF domain-containing protein